MSLIANEDLDNPSDEAMRNHKIIHSEKVTKEKLEETFASSKALMLGFKTKEEAIIFTGAALKGNNTMPDFIDGQIPFFAVPVVYTVEYDEPIEKELGALKAEQLLSYMESDTIPHYSSVMETGIFKQSSIALIDRKIASGIAKSDTINSVNVFQIPKENLRIVEAYYFACNPVREATVVFAHAKNDLDKIHNEENPPTDSPGCIIM